MTPKEELAAFRKQQQTTQGTTKPAVQGKTKPINAGEISPYSDVDITPYLTDEQLPFLRKEAVQNYQPQTGEGIFGKGVTREEFLKRNPKWAAAHPEFTTGKEHVGAFQDVDKGYNAHVRKIAYDDAIAKGYPEELAQKLSKAWVNTQGFHATKKGKYDPTTPDKAFGEYTSSRFEPSFKPYKKEIVPVLPKRIEIPAGPIVPGAPIVNKNVQGAAPWWLQDQITVGADAANFFRVKKHDPWQMKGQVAPYTPTFYDPTRELAANAEMANIGTQGLNAFTGPQSFNAGFSQIQGQGAKNAADILGRYNNLNVGVANDFEVRNKNLMNDASRYTAGLDTKYYDDTVRSQQDFENAKGIRRDMMVNHYKNAITNKMNTANLNDLYDQYKIDPRTGGRIRWTNGKPIKPEAQTDQWDSMASAVKRLTENGQFTRDEAIKIVTGQGGKNAGTSIAYNPMEGAYPMRTAADVDDTNF